MEDGIGAKEGYKPLTYSVSNLATQVSWPPQNPTKN